MQGAISAVQVPSRGVGGGWAPRLGCNSPLRRRCCTKHAHLNSVTAVRATPHASAPPAQPQQSAGQAHSEVSGSQVVSRPQASPLQEQGGSVDAPGDEQLGAGDVQQQLEQEQQQQQQPEYIEVEVTTEVEVEVEDKSFQPRNAVQQVHTYMTGTTTGQALSVAAAGLLLAAAAAWAYGQYQKANTEKARRKRQIERNNLLIKELNKYLPDKRFKLNSKIVKGLKNSTGFDNKEVFRKYLWYLLNERTFDQEAVEDLLVLKETAGLSDADVADALAERAQRVYDKYGTLLLNTEGFTSSGLQRKATCRALCQKVMFLAECDALVKRGSEASSKINLRVIFGASEEDMNKLRVNSITELTKEADQGEKFSDDELEPNVEDQLPHPPKTALDSQ